MIGIDTNVLVRFVTRDDEVMAQKAYRIYQGSPTGFTDILIGLIHKEYGCKTTYTFDKKAAKLADFTEV